MEQTSETLDAWLHVRCATRHLVRLRQLAKQAGISRADVVRSLIENAEVVEAPVRARIEASEAGTPKPGQ